MRALPLIIAVLVSPCMAMQATAASEDACERVFATVDLNSDGSLDAAEGLRYFAAMRVKGKPLTTDKLTKAAFIELCKADIFAKAKPDGDTPKEGRGDFTEADIRDRVLAEGFTEVSSLKQDDKGIWRGTAVWRSRRIGVAVDYSGSVFGEWGNLARQ
jgi:hypothetical protein